MRSNATILLILLAMTGTLRADFESWPTLARNAQRSGASEQFAPDLATGPNWITDTDEHGVPIEFVGQSGPVVWNDLVFAVGESANEDRLYAIERTDGGVRYGVPVGSPSQDSWSTPLIDTNNGSVIVTSDDRVRAFEAPSGAALWIASLELRVVNASAVVTTDLGPRDRLFITDADGFLINGGGHLYCINVDPFDEAANPYEPGEIVWTLPLGAASSGNSPAYRDGVIYVADAGDFNIGMPGRVRAFDAAAVTTPAPIWTFTNTTPTGFYGGVSLRGAHAYAASFTFNGGQDSANLVKLDASDGALVWSTPSNRTDSLPIALDDGRVLLSSGLSGFGSLPALQLFAADGTQLWDSAFDSFVDLDGDMNIEIGEFLAIGGWTHVPIVIENGTGHFAYAGTPPLTGGFFGPSTDVRLIDLDLSPSDPGFVIESFSGAGSTPAIADGVLYTIGAEGLHAFGVFAGFAAEDVNRDCVVSIEDLYSWEAGTGERDLTDDGVIDGSDRAALRAALRLNEVADVTGAGQ